MLGGLRKLLGLGGGQAQPQQQQAPQAQPQSFPAGFDAGTYANFKKANPSLEPTIEDAQRAYPERFAQPEGFQGDPAVLGYKPDITYNPTNNFVPFSTKNLPVGSNPQLTNTGGFSSQTPNFGDVLKRLRF